MLFALDHDGTYDRAPKLWNKFIYIAKESGHRVVCITTRGPAAPVNIPGCEAVHYTRGEAKVTYAERNGLKVDVWIDDRPFLLLNDVTRRLDDRV